jgi:hypothetical protein
MSIQILQGGVVEHKVEHDLESFFYVLLYICTMYEGPDKRNSGDRTDFEHPFGHWIDEATSWKIIATARIAAFLHPAKTDDLVFKHVHVYFRPLLPLLRNLCDHIFTTNHETRSADEPCGTHQEFLRILEVAFHELPDQDVVSAGDEPNVTDTHMAGPTSTLMNHPPSTILSNIGDVPTVADPNVDYSGEGTDSGYGRDDTLVPSTSNLRRSGRRGRGQSQRWTT